MTTAAVRPQRADAKRNREAILAAARKVFARDGADAQVDDIARVAKLGVGTLYRHFPTKEALYDALAADHFAKVTEIARESLAIDDPWEAFERMLWRAAEQSAGDRALAEVVTLAPDALTDAVAAREELQAIGARVMARAQRAGVVRRDAKPTDIPLVMCGMSSTVHTGRFPAGSWQRYLRIALDGLRADGKRTKLPDV